MQKFHKVNIVLVYKMLKPTKLILRKVFGRLVGILLKHFYECGFKGQIFLGPKIFNI
jgi:hypothetical protein